MNDGLKHDPVLRRFRAALTEIYGDRLDRAVLFGSRARGDHRADSDYDIALFLRDYTNRWDELWQIAGVTTDILVDMGAVVSPMPFKAGADQNDKPLMRAIAREGLDL